MGSEASGSGHGVLSRETTPASPRKARPDTRNLWSDAPLGAEDLAVLHPDRYLRQRGLGRTRDDLGAVGGIEDRAVARAGELGVLVGDGAAGVGADRRVGDELPAVEVDEHGVPAAVLELHGAARGHVGLRRDGLPAGAGGGLIRPARGRGRGVLPDGGAVTRTAARATARTFAAGRDRG